MNIPALGSRSTSWWAAPALTLLLLAAPAARSDDQPAAPPAAPVKPAVPTVKLLEPGAEPRGLLRLRIPKGQKEKAAVTLATTNLTPGATPALHITMEMTSEIKDISRENDAAYEMVLGTMTMDMGLDPGSSVSRAMGEALATLKGAVVSATVSERGRVSGMTIRLPEAASPLVKDTLTQTMEQMRDFGPPYLPEEPVGLGGRWEIQSSITVNGMTMDSTVVYMLKAREGTRIELDMTMTQTGKPQAIQNPALPAGVAVDLVSSTSTGSGQFQYDLTRLAPAKGTMKLSSKMTMSIKQGKSTTEQKTDAQMEMTMSGDLLPATTPK